MTARRPRGSWRCRIELDARGDSSSSSSRCVALFLHGAEGVHTTTVAVGRFETGRTIEPTAREGSYHGYSYSSLCRSNYLLNVSLLQMAMVFSSFLNTMACAFTGIHSPNSKPCLLDGWRWLASVPLDFSSLRVGGNHNSPSFSFSI